ncbi:MAG: DUF5667 domain-containing protein [Marmoricola sp.]
MSPQFPARRDAEDFARVLDGSASSDVAERYAGLARTVTLLREQAPPEPRADFVSDLRARLMAEADVALRPVEGAPVSLDAHRARQRGRRERRLGAAAAAVVLVGATTGMAAAAQGSLPGQTLYPLKRGIESVEVHLSTSDATRGQQLLDQASTRLSEVRALVESPSGAGSQDLVASTLADFTRSADAGSTLLFSSFQGDGDAADIAAVRDFTHGTMDVLRALAGTAGEHHSAFASAGATLADIDQQARVLCEGCSDAAPLSVPSSLVDLTSAAALQQLVTAPAQATPRTPSGRDRLRAEVEAAQRAAGQLTGGGSTGTGTPGDGTTSAPAPSAGPTDGPHLPGSTGSGDGQPLRHLVGGLVTALPGGVGGTVGGLTDGVTSGLTGGLTSGLGDTLDGVTGLVGGTLGGVTGLLGGTPTSSPSSTAGN